MRTVKNPIMPGFYPDPSICRVGEDFYMVNSTFSYFPGVPVFHSKNLADWEQIGNVLDRDTQVPLDGHGLSRGIFAPTIRFSSGTFYMITTNVSYGGNFIVTAKRPEGPWSEPHYLGDRAPGIDPSLFFDEDGAGYYIGQREKPVGCRYYGDTEIWIQKLNTDTLELEGDMVVVLDGFQKNAVWSEGPHLYHIGEYYYILHAESGTAFHHCIVAARSKNVFGPYEYCPSNPIITHRHLGKDYPVTCVGHGDLVDDGCGNWYMVMLACRPENGCTLLGRETFLAKVAWEDGWPVVNPGIGRLEDEVLLCADGCNAEGHNPDMQSTDGHNANVQCADGHSADNTNLQSAEDAQGTNGQSVNRQNVCGQRHYTFTDAVLPLEFLTIRNHREQVLSLKDRPGCLRLYMREGTLRDLVTPAYAGLRWQHKAFVVQTVLEPSFVGDQDCAGIALVQNEENHIRIEACQESGQCRFRVVCCRKGEEQTVACKQTDAFSSARIRVAVNGLSAKIWCAPRKGDWQVLAEDLDLSFLSTEQAGGFVGCTAGMYASGNGRDEGGYADFTEFTYQPA